jgi:DNA-binding MarR family transcriptional regulator
MAEAVDEANQMMRLLRQLTALADATLSVAGEVLAEFDLTVSAAALLCSLDPGAATPTMRELSRQMHCDPSTISLMADKLDRSGLVERRPHPTDGRKRTLALTDRGAEVWAALSRRLSETSALAALSAEERRTLEELLTKAGSA